MAKFSGSFTAIVIGSLLLVGCASPIRSPQSRDLERDSAPVLGAAELARLAQLPDPEVVFLPPSALGNGPTYEVWGQQYRVLPSAEGYRQSGGASWYGVKFHGRLTSSREPFDMYQLTAAHRSLPIPSFVRVTNLQNDKATVVRVNDRGPFHSERIIDLSYAAAVKLGFHEQGTTQVLVEALSADSPPVAAPLLQVGEYPGRSQALAALQQLQSVIDVSAEVVQGPANLFSVRIGPLIPGPELERVKALLTTMDFGRITVLSPQ
ncbi:MAG: septal ring lytic transglycosylase RlpA family protein [Pseudomonadota bacterium]|nr:septal ring lytic transglycosylase RlpA family protein [Pseudomonadota bacterium]